MRHRHQLDVVFIIHLWELQPLFIWLQHLEEILQGLEVQFHVLRALLAVIMDHLELVKDIGLHQNHILRQKWSWGYLECFYLLLLVPFFFFCFAFMVVFYCVYVVFVFNFSVFFCLFESSAVFEQLCIQFRIGNYQLISSYISLHAFD